MGMMKLTARQEAMRLRLRLTAEEYLALVKKTRSQVSVAAEIRSAEVDARVAAEVSAGKPARPATWKAGEAFNPDSYVREY